MSEINLETKHKELQSERSSVVSKLKRLNWKHQSKLIHSSGSKAGVSKNSEERPFAAPSKRRRSPTDAYSLETERPPMIEDPESLKKRNRNVFHSMLGHLQSARDTLQKDQSTIETQTKATHKVVEDLKKQEDARREVMREELNVRASKIHPDSEEATGGVRPQGCY